MRGHTPRMYTSRKLTTYKIYQLLYVNNGAFPFPTRDALIKGLALVHSHLARFGLKVHIGQDGAPSKTECVFFPPPQFFDDIHSSDLALTTDAEEPWLLFQDPLPAPESPHTSTTTTTLQLPSPQPTGKRKKKEKKETQENTRQKKINVKYDTLPETQQFEVADSYITFCCTFKYLGLHISYNLRNDANIEA
jgi:hypothetical protein